MKTVTMYICEIPWLYDVRDDSQIYESGIRFYKRLEDVPCYKRKGYCKGIHKVEVNESEFIKLQPPTGD